MKFYWKCLLKELFGIQCAGCGGSRMIMSVFRLEFYQAFRYNPGMFILLIVGILYVLYNVFLKLSGRQLYIPKTKCYVFISILLCFYMVLRNIPGFEFLLPTEV